jgi:quinol monooxygenase YgiN
MRDFGGLTLGPACARCLAFPTSAWQRKETMIYVVATIELAEGKREAFLAEQRHLLPLVRAEAGCVEYTPSVEVALGDPPKTPPRANVVVMQEKWESLDALRAHLTAPHMQEFRGKVKGLVLATKVEVFESK